MGHIDLYADLTFTFLIKAVVYVVGMVLYEQRNS